MRRTIVFLGLLGGAVSSLAALAFAQNSAVSAKQLAANARQYVNVPISLRGAYCYATDGGHACRTSEPLKIVLQDMPPGRAKSVMDEGCGELDGIEQSPSCRFSLQIVPTEVTSQRGDYARNGRSVAGRITVVTATVMSARRE